MVKVVNTIIIKDKKLVILRKEVDGKSSWIFPGGKPEEGEADLHCLYREISEELPRLILYGEFKKYGNFTGTSPNNSSPIEVHSYKFVGESNYDLSVSKLPSERIKEARMASYDELSKLALSEVAGKIVQSLKKLDEL